MLRLLRIDDDLPRGIPDPMPPQFLDQLPPAHLEAVRVTANGETFIGIPNWAMAVDYWKQSKQDAAPDLVVSDVQFVDATSPLAALGPQLKLPTGIGHFKLFAAMSRLRGMPIGVALHTADPMVWELSASGDDPIDRAMALLAAHDIGELAALLGDADDLPAGGTSACWNWLKRSTRPTFREAIPLALVNFRRRLAQVHVLPEDWDEACGWCGRMEMRCRADPTGRAFILDDADDPGLTVYGTDGVRDVLSFRSLFADVSLASLGFTFEDTGLPAKCFEVAPSETFYDLDDDGLPRIGALLAACGGTKDAYAGALRLLQQFPVQRETPSANSLTEVVRKDRHSRLAAALAILLQHLAHEHRLQSDWERVASEDGYDPVHDTFDQNSGEPLNYWLEVVARLARTDGLIGIADVRELFHTRLERAGRASDFPSAGPERCLKILADQGMLELDPETGLYLGTKQPRHRVRPSDLPSGFLQAAGIPDELAAPGGLREEAGAMLFLFGLDRCPDLGRNNDNHNAIQRIIQDAFALTNHTEATAFLENFRKGHMPSWVRELCRKYAREVLHWDEETWSAPLREPR